MDLDSTAALLSVNLPVGGDPNSAKKKLKKPEEPIVFVDSDEDEIFFGEKTSKEVNGKNSKFTRRETVHLPANGKIRGSLDSATITPKNIWTQYRCPQKDSIAEEQSLASPTTEENEENVDPKEDPAIKLDKLAIVPSPRKINMDKIETCERKYRSRSPLKNDLENMKTPPRRILDLKSTQDADSSPENSIIDVNNDQMFDDSIFTEYDDKNLSCMSAKMTKKWRKKWEKESDQINTFSPQTLDRLAAKEETLNEIQEEIDPNSSTCSEWFNTTKDEMVLYDKFGDDYDEVVNKMSHEEKLELKKEVDQINNPAPVPKPRTLTPVKVEKKFFASPRSLQNTPNYLKPTTASRMRMSPRKNVLSPNPVESCPRSGLIKSPVSDFIPRHKSVRRVGAAFNRDKIISPVGQYIRSHPVPPIVRQIRPKTTKHFDDDLAAFERDELRCQTPTEEKKRMFKPLPMAEYKSSKVALEQRVQNDKENDMKALPKVFGITPTVEAKIIRHVGRERVPKNAEFLRQQSPLGSVTVRKTPRESVMPVGSLDETNTMEMSIRQVVEVKKMSKSGGGK